MRERSTQNGAWIVRERPFRHVYVADVFEPEIYTRIFYAFEKKRAAEADFTKVNQYDAEIRRLVRADRGGFFPLLEPSWLKKISLALGLDTTMEIDAAIHSHAPGSRSGWIHNDYNPGWFASAAGPGSISLSSDSDFSYTRGPGATEAAATAVERFRYLALIYYFGNDGWRPELGGQTGLYQSARQPLDGADFLAEPRNNSLLAFECCPHSWHAFQETKAQRNSVMLWLHRNVESARRQWPHHDPVDWS